MINFRVANIEHILFTTEVEVRISDINYGNHLGHDSLVSLLHDARVKLLRSHQYTELDVEGCGFLLTKLFVNYKRQSFYGDLLQIVI